MRKKYKPKKIEGFRISVKDKFLWAQASHNIPNKYVDLYKGVMANTFAICLYFRAFKSTELPQPQWFTLTNLPYILFKQIVFQTGYSGELCYTSTRSGGGWQEWKVAFQK